MKRLTRGEWNLCRNECIPFCLYKVRNENNWGGETFMTGVLCGKTAERLGSLGTLILSGMVWRDGGWKGL